MNKNTIMGWILLMGLVLIWSQYKGKQAQEEQKQKLEQLKQDSLAKAAKAPRPDTADTARAAAAAPSQSPQMKSAPALAAGGSEAAGDTAGARVARKAITVETRRYILRLDNEGARIASLRIKDVDGKAVHNPDLIPADKGGALVLTLDNQDLGNALWRTDAPADIKVDKDSVAVAFSHAVPGGLSVKRTFVFHPDGIRIAHRFQAEGGEINSYAIDWPSGLAETEKIMVGKGIGLLSTFFSEVVLDNGATVDRETFEGTKTFNDRSGVLRWVGLRRKYMAAVINFNRETAHRVDATAVRPEGVDDSWPSDYRLRVSGSAYEEKFLDFDFLVLPLDYKDLQAMNQSYEKIIFSGWESFFRADVWYVALCGLVLNLLNFFHDLVPNYGIAIILLTLLVRTVTFPLTISQTKSAAKMSIHMPAIAKIREKHKGHPQKANAEIMEYYKKQGVNPLAGVMGCFPALLQMPIFIALFNVLGRAVELKDEPFFAWINDLSMPDVVWEGLKVPYLFPLGLTILPFFMAGTMYFQMKMTIKDPNQKMMVWMMPIMMFVFSCSFPSGLVLYWTVSNLFTIGQTYFYTSKVMKAAGMTPVAVKTKG